MELSERLAALAACIPAGSVAADIGTDHACLPVFLVEKGICPRVIATELNPGPFRSARRKLAEHNLEGKIDLRLGDGLKALEPGEAGVLVLAGMGGNTIREILSAAPDVSQAASRLILQPMADPGDLRTWLVANGWQISDEKLVEEGGRIYVVIVAEPGREKTRDPLLLELGPRLLEKKDPLLGAYLKGIMERYRRALDGLAAARQEAAREKAVDLAAKLARIREVAKCLLSAGISSKS
ncbi:MAG: class I SAM-dependent methyltransferase [Peptococcaceae bacterium]|nr:class I SAM-dependent methyltransferase [Peptococcaceae bacterium]